MNEQQPKFLNPLTPIERHENHLPHWQQDNATFFVTFRLGDSIPAAKLNVWGEARDAWLRLHPKPWSHEKEMEYHRLFSRQIEDWLDAGEGSCLLRDPRAAKIVSDALNHFEGSRCTQHCWVVMPNHVHALFSLLGQWTLEELLHSWKSFSAHAVNKLLLRTGEIWQKDYFDRLIRDRAHFDNCVRYILENPAKAKLRAGEFVLFKK